MPNKIWKKLTALKPDNGKGAREKGERTREKIIDLLDGEERLFSISEIAEHLGISTQQVSKQLKILVGNWVVEEGVIREPGKTKDDVETKGFQLIQ